MVRAIGKSNSRSGEKIGLPAKPREACHPTWNRKFTIPNPKSSDESEEACGSLLRRVIGIANANRINLDQDGDNANDYAFDAAGNTTIDAQLRKFTYSGCAFIWCYRDGARSAR